MADELVRQRVCIGRDVHTVAERLDGIVLEGRPRLRPGRHVDVTRVVNGAASVRRATVWSWAIAAVGRDGPIFRGICHWEDGSGERDTP